MSAERAVDVLQRFAALTTDVEGPLCFAPAVARRGLAASTEGELAVSRLYVARGGCAHLRPARPRSDHTGKR